MAYENEKHFLNKYIELDNKLIFIERTLYESKTACYGVVKGYSDKTLNDALEERDKIITELNMIKETINKVEDITLRYFLDYKYIGGQTIEQISLIMNYSDTHIKRLHKRSLEAISKYI